MAVSTWVGSAVTLVQGRRSCWRSVRWRMLSRSPGSGSGPGRRRRSGGGGCPTGSLWGSPRLRCLVGGGSWWSRRADGLDAAAREAVLALAGDPAAATAVVLRAAAPGRQGKFFKEVQRDAATVLVAKLRPSERSSWLRAQVRRLGRKADEAAVDGAGRHGRAGPPGAGRFRGQAACGGSSADGADRRPCHRVPGPDGGPGDLRADRRRVRGRRGNGPRTGWRSAPIDQVRTRSGRWVSSPVSSACCCGSPTTLSCPRRRSRACWAGESGTGRLDRARRQLRRFRPGDLHCALDLIAEADAHIRNGTLRRRALLWELLIARLAGAGAPASSSR